ncbi:MAG: hypothetical protein JF609_11185, partial [Verrucomicrobia bacterium]|nr:hypothetical protein [Verrucomicrobiota bacterium]
MNDSLGRWMRERGAWLGRVLMVLLLALPVTVRAQFQYSTIDGAVTITGLGGSPSFATIPSSIDGYPVTGIGNMAFYGHLTLQGVIIPGSVT